MQATRHRTGDPSARRRSAAVAGVCNIELLPPAPYEAAYVPGAPVIGFAFEAQTGMHAFASSRQRPFYAKPNHLSYVPPGCDVYSRSGHGGEYLRIVLDGGIAARRHTEHRFSNAIDATAIAAAESLRRLMIGDNCDPLESEYLVGLLTERAAAILAGGGVVRSEANWMTPHRLRLSIEHIEARLADRLTVHQLAADLGLSVGFFSRAFKAAVGKAPHDYIIDRRVSRAREMLQTLDQDLSAIAQAAGFSSHAHLSSVFRKRLGATPSAVRRRLCE
jgi:AraC family transcriptional regulator